MSPGLLAESMSAFGGKSGHRADLSPSPLMTQFRHSATAVKGAQDYNAKLFEFAQNNTKAAIEFAQKLSGVKSPSDFIELSSDHSRKQFETLTEQTKELAALAQKVTLATVEPLKTGVIRAFGQPT